jgi:hypothetical protein
MPETMQRRDFYVQRGPVNSSVLAHLRERRSDKTDPYGLCRRDKFRFSWN